MQNVFANPAFSMANLTAAINHVPNRYGRLEALNLFPAKPTRFRQILIEERNGVLNLLPTLPVGSPGTVGVRGKRKMRSFIVPHIPHDDVVAPEEVQSIRAFGSETELETVAGVLAQHLETMRNKHAITLEHLRMGALKGVILDADGSVLYDLFDEFGITSKSTSFALASDGTNVRQKCIDVLAHIEDNLRGEFITSVRCLCSPEFFEKLTGHTKVEKAYENFQQGVMLRDDVRAGFTFGHYLRRISRPGHGWQRRQPPLYCRRRSARISGGNRRHLCHLLLAGRFQRDRQHAGSAVVRETRTQEVRARH